MSNTAQELLPYCNKTSSKNRKNQKSRTILKQHRLKEKKMGVREGRNSDFKSRGRNIFEVSVESCQGYILHIPINIEVAYQ